MSEREPRDPGRVPLRAAGDFTLDGELDIENVLLEDLLRRAPLVVSWGNRVMLVEAVC